MITPLDIQNKKFSKNIRGYKEEEVDAFLDLITTDLERIIEENSKHKEAINVLKKEVEKYKGSEGAVLETLEAAKSLMGDISASAEKRAQILLKNAELDAELIQREAKESVERLNEEAIAMKNRLSVFKTRYKSLLETELEKFDILSEEIFVENDFEDLKGFTEVKPNADEIRIPSELNVESSKKTITNLRMGDGA
ncbi:DivIVA domain-containing protein [Anaerovorax odorimutans]|uniref:DivIVA domain-containing protein n=1 Tax=Anaerovorax odorimutans TaxID=109327 RepID=UPI0004075BE6|nr:DivIVA domain-containing protein [Anaerovorax odorimutans]